MASKICPVMSNSTQKVDCDINCAFCMRYNGQITCAINILMENTLDINKKLDSVITNQRRVR